MHTIQALTDPRLTQALLVKLKLPIEINKSRGLIWAARLAENQQGAGFSVLWPAQDTAHLWLHVAPAFRNQHCARDLLEVAEKQCRELGATKLELISAVEHEDAPWFIKRGFTVSNKFHNYSIQGDIATAQLRRVWDRLKSKVPAEAQLITLAQAIGLGLSEEICIKQASVTGGMPDLIRSHIDSAIATGTDELISLQSSLVGMLNGKIVSILMVRFDYEQVIWIVEAMYLEQAYRDGWALIWMRFAIAEVLLATARTNECHFEAQDDQPAIIRLAHRLKAQELPGRVLLQKNLVS